MDFGKELKTLRKDRGLSIRELSRSCDISHAYLSQLESNQRKAPKLEILIKISIGLKIPIYTILDWANYDKGGIVYRYLKER